MEVKCKFEKFVIRVNAPENISTRENTNGLIRPTEEKWEMKPNAALQGATGRLLLDLPADVECFIYIYGQADKKRPHFGLLQG